MAGDDDPIRPISNLLVRWKQHVDHHIGNALNSVFGVPTVLSRTYGSGDVDGVNGTGGLRPAGSAIEPAPSAPPTQNQLLEGFIMRQWYEWTVSSPYSPFNLQNLPPPVPRDLPAADADLGSPGGFADAFEDLLRTTSGQAFLDHHERRRRLSDDRLARRTYDRRVLWLAGLRHDGLLAAQYPAGSAAKALLSPPKGDVSTPSAWLAQLRRRGVYDLAFPQTLDAPFRPMHLGGFLGIPHPDPWPTDWEDVAARAFRGVPSAPAEIEGALAGVGRVMSEVERMFGMPGPASDAQDWRQPPDKPSHVLDKNGIFSSYRWPDTEEDLFDGLQRRTEQPPPPTDAVSAREPGKHSSTETTQEADGTTTVRTREEEVDDNGNVRRVKVVTRTLDPDGNEIARRTESRYQARFGGKWSWGDSNDEQDGSGKDGAKSQHQQSGDKKGSWFWK